MVNFVLPEGKPKVGKRKQLHMQNLTVTEDSNMRTLHLGQRCEAAATTTVTRVCHRPGRHVVAVAKEISPNPHCICGKITGIPSVI